MGGASMKIKYFLMIGIMILLISGFIYFQLFPKYDIHAVADREGNTFTTYKDGSTLTIFKNGTQVKTESKTKLFDLFNWKWDFLKKYIEDI